MSTRKVVVIDFEDSENLPGESDLIHALNLGLVQHGYDAKSIILVGKDKALWFPESRAIVRFEECAHLQHSLSHCNATSGRQ
jgi:hypothetical protein